MTYTPRHVESRCQEALAAGKILVLLGARQTGKSTLASALLADEREDHQLLLNLDDPFLRDRLVSVEGALQSAMEDQAGRPWNRVERFTLVLDEAQKAPALFEVVKALHDSNRGRLRVILTGSSALEIHDPVAESLAGRVSIQTIFPFSLSEGFAHSAGDDPTKGPLSEIVSAMLCGRFTPDHFDQLAERGRWVAPERRRWVEEHLRFPLFPEPSNDSEPEAWIRDYLMTYLEKDVQSLATVGNVQLFRSCIRQVAARVGSTMKWEPAAQEVGTTSVTLRKYVGLMEQTLNLVRLGSFTVNPVRRVVRAPKLYLIDCGLMWGLRGFEDRRLLNATGIMGSYAEAAAIVEIAKWASLEPTAPELRFWMKTKVSEVDLVVSNRGYHIPFEVKLGRALERRWFRGLDAFEADHRPLGLEVPYRVILHMGEPERPDDRTFAIPLWMLA